MQTKNILNFIFFLSIIGILLSAYLTGIHYTEKGSFCDINDTISCSTVSNSPYSEMFGIPVSIFGLIGYTLFALSSFFLREKPKWLKEGSFAKKLFSIGSIYSLSLIALIFSLYLTYHEIFTIKAICILCILSQIIILIIAGLGYSLKKKFY
ncbi:MAG: vitamin K epoxide reductase family protein [Candidatus Woesearchaeota archaeon]